MNGEPGFPYYRLKPKDDIISFRIIRIIFEKTDKYSL